MHGKRQLISVEHCSADRRVHQLQQFVAEQCIARQRVCVIAAAVFVSFAGCACCLSRPPQQLLEQLQEGLHTQAGNA
jgi:type II secretory pathway component PulM